MFFTVPAHCNVSHVTLAHYDMCVMTRARVFLWQCRVDDHHVASYNRAKLSREITEENNHPLSQRVAQLVRTNSAQPVPTSLSTTLQGPSSSPFSSGSGTLSYLVNGPSGRSFSTTANSNSQTTQASAQEICLGVNGRTHGHKKDNPTYLNGRCAHKLCAGVGIHYSTSTHRMY